VIPADVVRRHLVDGVGGHDAAVWDEIMHADFVMHFGSGGGRIEGRAAYAAVLDGYWRAFPDLRIELLRLLTDGDLVTAHYVERGTQTGPFFDVAPSGRSYAKNGLGIYCVRDGRMVEAWIQEDDLAFTTQLGLALPPT
jgi:predicted ester cyclase